MIKVPRILHNDNYFKCCIEFSATNREDQISLIYPCYMLWSSITSLLLEWYMSIKKKNLCRNVFASIFSPSSMNTTHSACYLLVDKLMYNNWRCMLAGAYALLFQNLLFYPWYIYINIFRINVLKWILVPCFSEIVCVCFVYVQNETYFQVSYRLESCWF